MHPLAIENKNGFTDRRGEEVKAGDKVIHLLDEKTAILDEALHDGDALVTWEDGSFGTVKWHNLLKAGDAL